MIEWDEVQAMKVKDISPAFCLHESHGRDRNVDPQFHRNWRKSKQAGITRGRLSFFHCIKGWKNAG